MQQEEPSVAVIGAGLMGTCIAGELAYHGARVNLYDRSAQAMEKSKEMLIQQKEQLKREEVMATSDFIGTVAFCESLEEAVVNSGLIFEATIENLEVKKSVFKSISQFCRTNAVIATNTLALDTSVVAEHVTNPERCLGIRFLYPVYSIPEVEITLGSQTSPETIQKVQQFLEGKQKTLFFRSGKKPLVLSHSQVEDRKKAQRQQTRNWIQEGRSTHDVVPNLGHGVASRHAQASPIAMSSGKTSQSTDAEEECSKESECVVCMDNRRDTVLCPCHHLCVCGQCAAALQLNEEPCPICRQAVASVIHVYQP
ncbi:predicted protein [Nematostella vectensis]|uniref:RING-type domain-containing protein n=1 Tax=Nematostella vectensis TaxID=45351 RepID=A7S4Z9_NEMVE|nr:5-formyl-3-hydroxy-2-methylpyridine 4-carboxylate 5-dehydrogenase isoform X2 [Nematostella vectensis]EDO41282.1 predicted protein [Nematostella vectensis]|eukprot:XP_001633345.1 predicted protein [Nematostella vectensis]